MDHIEEEGDGEEVIELEELAQDGGEGFDAGDEGELAPETCEEEGEEGQLEEDGQQQMPVEPAGADTSSRSYRGHSSSVYTLSVSKGLVASGSGDDTCHVWDLASCSCSAVLRSEETVNCVAFSATGKFLATGSCDALVRIYSASSYGAGAAAASSSSSFSSSGAAAQQAAPVAPLHVLEGLSGEADWLAWHPLGDVLLAGSSDGTAWMWSVAAAAADCMTVFAGHEGAVTCGMFTTDGKMVVTGSEDGSLRVWSPKSGSCVFSFGASLRGWGEAPLIAVAASPFDCHIVCTTAMDGTARVVNLSTRKVMYKADHNESTAAAGAAGGGARGGEEEEGEEECTSVER
jgi:WD40 repeat protein